MPVERVSGHAVKPIEHESPGARRLTEIGHSFSKDVQGFYDRSTLRDPAEAGYKPASRSEMSRESLKVMDRAAEFSLDLPQYWSSTRETLSDVYQYGEPTVERFEKRLEADFKSIDRNLEQQLGEWQEATSPSAEYDPDRIGGAAKELLKTIGSGREALDARLKEVNLKNLTEVAYVSQLDSALTGLSEQIAERLRSLAGGGVVEPVTMSTQTRELIERASRDPIGDELRRDLETKRDDLTKKRETRTTNRESISNRTRELDQIRRELKSEELTAQQRTEKEGKATELEQALSRLKSAAARLDVSVAAADAALSQSIERGYEYDQSLTTATSELANGRGLAEFWGDTKSQLFDAVDAVAGKEVRKALDAAFDGNLAGTLGDFKKLLKADKLKPQELQATAATLLQTLDTYARRTTAILSAEKARTRGDASAAIQQVIDSTGGPIAAMRSSIATELNFLFKNGAFDAR
jgi:hypothetical protein